jgi:hypothetical protein
MTALHPVGRVSTPAEVAEVVALPLSPAPGPSTAPSCLSTAGAPRPARIRRARSSGTTD